MRQIVTLTGILTILGIFIPHSAQSQNCDSITPVFSVNLTGNPTGTWISPSVQRQGLCCGNTNPNTCIQFDIILDPAATGINFGVFSGAMPGGSLFYQVNCGPLTSIGTPICLTGTGPHILTFCKPGTNINQFSITSIADPVAGPDLVVNDGCSGYIGVTGLDPTTITWQSVGQGANGTYNSYLNCLAGCDSVLVTGQTGAPAYVDYQVCGTALGVCSGMSFCDTIRVMFNPTLVVGIQPNPAIMCAGMSGINLTATGTGGTPPYTFTWSNGTVTTSSSTSQVFVGPGTFTVSMQDNSTCPPVTDQVTVVSYPVPVVANAGADQNVCRQTGQVNLSGTITGTNNAIWTGGNGTFTPSNTVTNPVYTPTAAELASGSVTLILEANNGACTPDFDTVVINFKSFTGVPLITSTNVTCNGAQDGSLTASVTGNNTPYTYTLNGNAFTPPATGLSPGTYVVSVSDGYGCDTTLTTTIVEPTALTGSVQVNSQVSCYGGANGQAQITVSGGTPPYSYTLNGSPIASSIAGNLTAGSYFLGATDANGCILQLPFSITEPALLSSSVGTSGNVSCNGGNDGFATVTPTGGVAPYTFSWNTVPVQTTATAANLVAGTYTVTVSDANSCTSTSTVTITQPTPLNASVTATDATCSGYSDGSAMVTISGGTSPYVINWSNSGTGNTINNNIPAGSYTVTVTDNNGCNVLLPFDISEPSPVTLSLVAKQNVTCNGFQNGTALVSASGGTQGYTYSWNTTPQQYSAMASSLGAGNYLASVMDVNGCFASLAVNITQPSPLTLTLSSSNVTCYGANDGSVSATASGGTPPYHYDWSTGGQGSTLNGLGTGSYTVNLNDSNNCLITDSTSITEPDPVDLITNPDTVICPGGQASLWAYATGGKGGYLYSWTHGLGTGTGYNVSPNSTTSYIVNAQDSTGCAAAPDTIIVNIQYLEPEWIIADVTSAICEGDTATLTSTITSPYPQYTLNWSHGLGSSAGPIYTTPVDSTTYTLTLTDQCGNTIQDTATVIVHPNPVITMPSLIGQGCPPLTLTMPPQPGAPSGSTYVWDFGNGTSSTEDLPEIEYTESGNYYVNLQVTSPFGCKTESQFGGLVRVHPLPTAYFEPNYDIVSLLNPIIFFKNHSFGGVTYHWDFGDGGMDNVKEPLHAFKQAGTYTTNLLVTNEYGCEAEFKDDITVTGDFALYIPNAFSPNGDGENDQFGPKGVGYMADSYEMRIFNRWGQMVYFSDDFNDQWDGTFDGNLEPLIDTYVYKIYVRDIFKREHEYVGHVTLVR